MSRIKEINIYERLAYLNEHFNECFEVKYFNGFCHLYRKGENIITGTKRQVFDAMYFIIIGLNLK